MADALLRNAVTLIPGVSPDRYDIASAGTDPAGSLDGVADVLREVGSASSRRDALWSRRCGRRPTC
jgi:hypothetical protein